MKNTPMAKNNYNVPGECCSDVNRNVFTARHVPGSLGLFLAVRIVKKVAYDLTQSVNL
jgi:hypothetical protein